MPLLRYISHEARGLKFGLSLHFDKMFVYMSEGSGEFAQTHTGKCIRRFAGIYAYCRYFIDRM